MIYRITQDAEKLVCFFCNEDRLVELRRWLTQILRCFVTGSGFCFALRIQTFLRSESSFQSVKKLERLVDRSLLVPV